MDIPRTAGSRRHTLTTAHDPAAHLNLYYPRAGHGAAGEPRTSPALLSAAHTRYMT